jgi:hypothetical protein
MKVETGSFSPASSSTTVYLDDSSIQIKAIEFFCTGTGSTVRTSIGFDDGIKPRSQWTFQDGTGRDSNRSTTNSVTLKDRSGGVVSDAQVGKVASGGLSTAGEFTMSWSSYTTTPVYFKAIGV